MKKVILTVGLVLSVLTLPGQVNDSLNNSNRYSNPDFGYRLTIPSWLKVLNTGHHQKRALSLYVRLYRNKRRISMDHFYCNS
jgi:hypothetical protein